MNKAKGSGFAARTWLENDGDDTSQSLAALRGDLGGRHWLAAGPGPRVAFQRGKTVEDQQVAQLCASADVVILPEAEVAQSDSCHLIAKNRLKASGAIAVYDGPGGLRVVGAAEEVGSRVWNTR